MQRSGIQNLQSLSGISGIGIGANHQSLMNDLQSKQQILYTIKINGPQDGQLLLQTPSKKDESEKSNRFISHKTPYNLQTTGYDINRDLYSEQQIKQAFKVIDINKDGVLTFDEISFFLNCMGEEHTSEEVQEMINMISTDGKVVALDDFRKISKGKISPFGAIKVPEQSAQGKQVVLNNLLETNLIDLQPDLVIAAQQSEFISYEKFAFEKQKKNEHFHSEIVKPVQQHQPLLRSRTNTEIQEKRKQFSKLTMLNIERIIQTLNCCCFQYLQSGLIAQLITIDQIHARKLFTGSNKKVLTKQVLLDAILFSSKSPIEKLYLILDNYKREQLFSFEEWMQVLVFMVGSDQREIANKRLLKLLKHKKIDKNVEFDKHYIVKLMSQQIFNFNC